MFIWYILYFKNHISYGSLTCKSYLNAYLCDTGTTESQQEKDGGNKIKSYLFICWLVEKRLRLLIISVLHVFMLSLSPHN